MTDLRQTRNAMALKSIELLIDRDQFGTLGALADAAADGLHPDSDAGMDALMADVFPEGLIDPVERERAEWDQANEGERYEP